MGVHEQNALFLCTELPQRQTAHQEEAKVMNTMNTLKRRCPRCLEWIEMPDDGSKTKCPYCQNEVSVTDEVTDNQVDKVTGDQVVRQENGGDDSFSNITFITPPFARFLYGLANCIIVGVSLFWVYSVPERYRGGTACFAIGYLILGLLVARITYELIVVAFECYRKICDVHKLLTCEKKTNP